MKPQDILADDTSEVEIGGIAVRKGSIAAFLANAAILRDPATGAEDRDKALNDIALLVPALRAVGLFDTLSIKDAELRAYVEAQP